MGNTNVSKLANVKANFTPQADIVQSKLYEGHYGDVEVVREKATGRLLIHKTLIFDNLGSIQTELNALHSRVQLKHPNVVEIIGYNSTEEQKFCAVHSRINIYIEVIDHTLLNELENRRNTRTAFTEEEVLLVADSAVSALSYFQTAGYSHGDIRPYNIFVSQAAVKLSDPSLTPYQGQHGLVLALHHGVKALLAPELLENVTKKSVTITANKNKCDVFSLGATLLALATLSNSEDLYAYGDNSYTHLASSKLNQTLLNERLDQVRLRYSPFTFELIKSMLQVQPASRPDFVALANSLAPYRDRIRAHALRIITPSHVVAPITQVYTAPVSHIVSAPVSHVVTVPHGEVLKRSAYPTSPLRTSIVSPTKVTTTAPTTTYTHPVTTTTVPSTYTVGTTLPSNYTTHAPSTYTVGTTLPSTYTTHAPSTYTVGATHTLPSTYTVGTTIPSTQYVSGAYTSGYYPSTYSVGSYGYPYGTAGTYLSGATVLPTTTATTTGLASSQTVENKEAAKVETSPSRKASETVAVTQERKASEHVVVEAQATQEKVAPQESAPVPVTTA